MEIRVDGQPVGHPRRPGRGRARDDWAALRPRRRAGRRRRPLPERRGPAAGDRRQRRARAGRHRRLRALQRGGLGRPAHRELAFLAGVSTPSPRARRPCTPAPYDGELAPVLTGGDASPTPTRRRHPVGGLGRCATAPTSSGVPAGGRAADGQRHDAARARPGRRPALSPGRRPRGAGRAGAGRRSALRRHRRPRRGRQRRAAGPARRSRPTLSQVVDVAWRDSGSCCVLAGDPAPTGSCPTPSGVDGWGADHRPVGRAAQPAGRRSPPRRPASRWSTPAAPIWQLAGGTWVTLVRGAGAAARDGALLPALTLHRTRPRPASAPGRASGRPARLDRT